MKLTNFGGATAVLEHRGKRMLFDPWLDDGIYHGAWYHYPPLKLGLDDMGKIDYAYISHIHEDHCSADTIRRLSADTEILVIDREPNYVVKFLDAQGFRFRKIHKIKPYQRAEIAPGLWAGMVEADPAHELNYLIDSGLLLDWDGFTVYNANDCPPSPQAIDHIQKNYKKIDLALLPYAGGSGYPACYTNLSDGEKRSEMARIADEGLSLFTETVAQIKPRYAMPFADQYVVAGSRSDLNRYMAHPPDGGVVESTLEKAGLGDKTLLLNAGQAYDFEADQKIPQEPFHHHTEEEKRRYIRDFLKDKTYDHEKISFNFSVPIERLLTAACKRLWEMQKKQVYFPDFSYYLELPDRKRRFHIPLNRQEMEEVGCDSAPREPYLKVSMPSSLLVLILLGHVSWNIADAALFLDYERVPNRYDPKIHAFINHIRI